MIFCTVSCDDTAEDEPDVQPASKVYGVDKTVAVFYYGANGELESKEITETVMLDADRRLNTESKESVACHTLFAYKIFLRTCKEGFFVV